MPAHIAQDCTYCMFLYLEFNCFHKSVRPSQLDNVFFCARFTIRTYDTHNNNIAHRNCLLNCCQRKIKLIHPRTSILSWSPCAFIGVCAVTNTSASFSLSLNECHATCNFILRACTMSSNTIISCRLLVSYNVSTLSSAGISTPWCSKALWTCST